MVLTETNLADPCGMKATMSIGPPNATGGGEPAPQSHPKAGDLRTQLPADYFLRAARTRQCLICCCCFQYYGSGEEKRYRDAVFFLQQGRDIEFPGAEPYYRYGLPKPPFQSNGGQRVNPSHRSIVADAGAAPR